MIASKHVPLKTLLLSAGLSASLALLGCATNGIPTSGTQGPQPLQPPAQPLSDASPAVSQPVSMPNLNSDEFRYSWSSDRILSDNTAIFQTTSFQDAIKPRLELPAVEKAVKNPSTSQGSSNEFAKNLPGAQAVDYSPNTPAVIGTTSYFLTASTSSVNFFALDNNGQINWELSLHENGHFAGTSPEPGKANPNTLFAITEQGRLYAVNANSGLVTSFVQITADTFENTSPFTVSDGGGVDSVYLTSQEGRVYRYTFNGSGFTQGFTVTPVSSSSTGVFSASPVVTANHIYVGSEEGRFYKLNRLTGATVSSLNLTESSRAAGCQIKSAVVIDTTPDTGIVSCGSYAFKLRLNDASTIAAMSLAAQSPLLELQELITLNPTMILGPNHNNRPQLQTSVARDPEPSVENLGFQQSFGFKAGDFIRVESLNSGLLYAEIEEISDEGEITLKGDGLYPLPSPEPETILFGDEPVHLANWVVRPTPVPEEDAVVPVPTPTPVGADPVTQFTIGSPDGITSGDYIRFPTLANEPVFQVCSNTNPDCDSSATTKYPGVQLVIPEEGGEDEAFFQVTVPGAGLSTLITNELALTRFVPLEKIQNQVVNAPGFSNSTQEFSLGSVKDFQAGQTIRVTHRNGSAQGRFEYSVIESVNQVNRRIRLLTSRVLRDAPVAGDQIDIVEPNSRAFGRVLPSQKYSSGNILSEPVLRGNGQHAYVQHGNVLFELNYGTDSAFQASANYLVLQSARLEQGNRGLTALSHSRPMVTGDKLLTVDTDPSMQTGIFFNRVLLPLSTTSERINDVFPVLSPNSLGRLSHRAETRPVLVGNTGFFMVSGGNGIAYKLHKDFAW